MGTTYILTYVKIKKSRNCLCSVDWVYIFFFVFESVFNCLLIVLVLGCDNNRLPKYWWWKTFLTCLYKNFFENQSFSSGNAENLSNFITLSKKGEKELAKTTSRKMRCICLENAFSPSSYEEFFVKFIPRIVKLALSTKINCKKRALLTLPINNMYVDTK